jgi:hypothetical protein
MFNLEEVHEFTILVCWLMSNSWTLTLPYKGQTRLLFVPTIIFIFTKSTVVHMNFRTWTETYNMHDIIMTENFNWWLYIDTRE